MKRAVIALELLLAVSTARGNVVLHDAFSYADGPLAGATGSPWTSHSGTAGQSAVTNGQLQVTFRFSEDVNAGLAGAPYTGESGANYLYASFKLTCVELPSGPGSYIAHFKDNTSSGFRGRIFALTNGAVGPGTFSLGIGSTNSNSGSLGYTNFPTSLSTGVTYLVVSRLDLLTGGATLWVNPADETDTAVSSGPPDPGTALPIHAYAFRQASGIGRHWVDDLKVGTTFADVAGANSPPVIPAIGPFRLWANEGTGPVPFAVSDAETEAQNLELSASSSNPDLLPVSGIEFGGSGGQRTVTITPLPGEQGVATVTIFLSDGIAVSSTSFTVSVGLPVISVVADQKTGQGTALGPVAFTVADHETPVEWLTLTASSSNKELVPDESIVFGGQGSNRTVQLTPTAGLTGLTTITITVNDGANSARASFELTVFPRLGVVKQDDFNRPDGPLVDMTGAWISHSGTFQETGITNGQVVLGASRTEDVSVEFTGAFQPQSGIILYARFDVQFTQAPTSTGNYFAHFKDEASGFRGRIFASSVGTNGLIRLGVANNATAVPSAGWHPVVVRTGQTHTVVLQYSVADGQSVLWVDPASESDTSVAATDNPFAGPILAIAFRQASGIGTLLVDNLKIGTEFVDVVTTRPRLTFSADAAGFKISWPAALEGYVLQQTTDLGTGSWGNVPELVVTEGDRMHVQLEATGQGRFFRLIKW